MASPVKFNHKPEDVVFDPMNRDFAFGRMTRPGSVQMWLDRKARYLEIERKNQEKRQRNHLLNRRLNTSVSLPSVRNNNSDEASFQMSKSSSETWRCPPPPRKGSDSWRVKSNVDLRYYEKDPQLKYKRLIGHNWFVLKSLKPFYCAPLSTTEQRKESPKPSTSDGSQLTEKSVGSFSDDFDLANTLRNKERAEMREIKKYIQAIINYLVNRAHARFLKNEAAGRKEVFEWQKPTEPEVVKPNIPNQFDIIKERRYVFKNQVKQLTYPQSEESQQTV